MKLISLTLALATAQLFVGCEHKNANRVESVTEVTTVEEDDIEPPLTPINSKFTSLQDWLFNACDKEKPDTFIASYNFGLFESEGKYTVFYAGMNEYQKGKDTTARRIDFKPTDMYFPLPEKYYGKLTRQQIMDSVKLQLRRFTNSEKFKTSFFATAKSIMSPGGNIWPANSQSQ